MPKTKATNIRGIDLPDLVYAVGRLVQMGKTTTAEVQKLAKERTVRIAQLEAELHALKQATITPLPAPTPAKAKPAKATGAKPPAKPKPKFTLTPKAREFRKVQGQYMGHLRKFQGKEREAIKAVAASKGIPAGLAEIMKRLGKGATTPKVAAKAAREAAGGAKPRKKAMPASYYRCAHPRCTKNWYVNGRPYCGEHARKHGKGKP